MGNSRQILSIPDFSLIRSIITQQSHNQIPPIVRPTLRQAQDVAPCMASLMNHRDEVKRGEAGCKKLAKKGEMLHDNTIRRILFIVGYDFNIFDARQSIHCSNSV
ncbi:MAG: hypothetical protein B6D34_00665 [Candidatus Brocadia sp. UTAMX1]|nr:MAG: hypothetical protein B6D34_00665 [Candidatus Brocadia sp. UTAMX1]